MHLDGEVYHSWLCLQETFVTKIEFSSGKQQTLQSEQA